MVVSSRPAGFVAICDRELELTVPSFLSTLRPTTMTITTQSARRTMARLPSILGRPTLLRLARLPLASRRPISSSLPSSHPAAPTPSSSSAPFFVTTPIFYVNAGEYYLVSDHRSTTWLTCGFNDSAACRSSALDAPRRHPRPLRQTAEPRSNRPLLHRNGRARSQDSERSSSRGDEPEGHVR